MAEQINIREAVEDDVSVIVELWNEFIDFHVEREEFFRRSATAEETIVRLLSDEIAGADSCILVAEVKGEVIGYCNLTLSKYPPVYHVNEYGMIGSFAIAEGFRRSGAGTKSNCDTASGQGANRFGIASRYLL